MDLTILPIVICSITEPIINNAIPIVQGDEYIFFSRDFVSGLFIGVALVFFLYGLKSRNDES